MRHIVSAMSVPCPWCRAEPGENCRRSPRHHPSEHIKGVHGARIKDAELVQRTMEVLLDGD